MRAPPELTISVSQVKTWLRCPRQYQLRYVQGVPAAFVPVALAFGSCFHSALGFFYGTLKTAGSAPPLLALQQLFVDAWSAAGSGPIPLQNEEDDEDLGKQLDKGVGMLAAFYAHATAQPVSKVEAIELPFSVPVHHPETGEVLEEKLVGVIDLVVEEDGHKVIVEHKSSSKKYTLDQFKYDLQPTCYQLAAQTLGWGEVGLRYQVVTKAKTAAVQVEDVLRDEQDTDDFLHTVVGVLRAVDCGVFFPVRGWQCRSCQYAHACEGPS